jgi:hypothetical protein
VFVDGHVDLIIGGETLFYALRPGQYKVQVDENAFGGTQDTLQATLATDTKTRIKTYLHATFGCWGGCGVVIEQISQTKE